jgi:hypothetical protein
LFRAKREFSKSLKAKPWRSNLNKYYSGLSFLQILRELDCPGWAAIFEISQKREATNYYGITAAGSFLLQISLLGCRRKYSQKQKKKRQKKKRCTTRLLSERKKKLCKPQPSKCVNGDV